MHQSKDEYLMLREEILCLSNMENNVMNFFYISIAAIMAFSLTQQDTISVLLPYLIIIPAYKLVLSKIRGIYKAGAYLYVFHEGKNFNWEKRSLKFIQKMPQIFLNKMQAFNYPFLLTSIFTTIVFLLRTNWENITTGYYDLIKVIMAILLFCVIIIMIMKNRRMDISDFIPCWQEIKNAEEKKEEQGGMIVNNEEMAKCKYKDLRKILWRKDHMANFKAVCDCIDEKIGNGNDKKEQLEALICCYEGQSNTSNSYTLIAIGYALLIGVSSLCCTLKSDYQEKVIMASIIVLGLVTLLVCGLAICILKRDSKDKFILKVLYFKLEEINNKGMNYKNR